MSSRRKNAANKPDKQARTPFVARPFEGLPDETDWVALREVVPAATAPLSLKDGTPVILSTVLPLAWPGMVRADGLRYLGLQVASRSGDASRDLAAVLELVVAAAPGSSVAMTDLPGPGARLQDLLSDAPLDITIHSGFDFWVEGADDPDGEVAASMERANATVVPTARLASVRSAYWCRMRERSHLRWVLPHEEERLLDALARMSVAGGLGLGDGTRYVGSFRAHGLLVPVWDLPLETVADEIEEPARAWGARLDAALAETGLTSESRRARQGLVNRQLTLR
ncbi:MAG: hypothetical protein JWL79_1162 [Frankiales bacterium]|nr:hypothetical protein [Frankiales bacterium]